MHDVKETTSRTISQDLAQPSCAEVVPPVRRSTRNKLKRRFTTGWVAPPVTKTHCICRSERFGLLRWIQCESCYRWYHQDCVGLSLEKSTRDCDIVFRCGLDGCNKHTWYCTVKGKCINSYRSLQIDLSGKPDTANASEQDSCSVLSQTASGGNVIECNFATTVIAAKQPVVDGTSFQFPVICNNTDASQSQQSNGNGVHHATEAFGPNSATCNTATSVFNISNTENVMDDQAGCVILPKSDSVHLLDHCYWGYDTNVGETCSKHKSLLSQETLNQSLQCSVPEGDSFEQMLPTNCSFNLDFGIFDSLPLLNNKRFARGCWQTHFVNGMKESNDKCVFVFKRHYVNKGEKSNILFQASGKCSVPGCPITFKLTMTNKTEVNVTYDGCIKHPLFGRWSRPVRTSERKKLAAIFVGGTKPYKHYMESLHEKPGDVMVAGNYDGLGATPSVLQKIAAEGKQADRLDKDVYESLQQMQLKFSSEVAFSKTVPGFIQFISIVPVITHLWTETGVRLWHELSKNSAVYFDATGSVVKETKGSSKLLYYELSCRNPCGNGPSAPVGAFISSCQNVPTISHFLTSFRDSQKKVFGFKNVQIPCLINVDFSMALIVSILNVFNGQTVDNYLEWCWDLFSGNFSASTFEKRKTVVHVCMSHFMHLVKLHCVKIFKSGLDFVLFIVSAMANSFVLSDVNKIFYDFCIVFMSKFQSDVFKHSFSNLNLVIGKISVSCYSDSSAYNNADTCNVCCKTFIMCTCYDQTVGLNDSCNGNVNCSSEGDFLGKSPRSPFASWFNDIYNKACSDITVAEAVTCEQNNYYSPIICEKILKLYMPTLPLWSCLMFGDLRRHSTGYLSITDCAFINNLISCTSSQIPRTNGSQEQRFNVIKNIALSGRKCSRLDDFVAALYKHFLAVQKEFVTLYCRKLRTKCSKPLISSKNAPVTEEWQKKQKVVNPVKNLSLGKYQQQPFKPLKNLNNGRAANSIKAKSRANNSHGTELSRPNRCVTNIRHTASSACNKALALTKSPLELSASAMQNMGSSCWFNASVQAFARSLACLQMLLRSHENPDVCDDAGFLQQTVLPIHRSPLLTVLNHLRIKSPCSVSDQLLRNVSSDAYMIPELSITDGIMHDCSEFFDRVIFKLLQKVDNCPCTISRSVCVRCRSVLLNTEAPNNLIWLDLVNINSNVTITVGGLIKASLGNVIVTGKCNSDMCHATVCNLQNTVAFTFLPDTLVLALKRFKQETKGLAVKDTSRVLIDMVLSIPVTSSNEKPCVLQHYKLTSFICHQGDALDVGHYYAGLVRKTKSCTYLTLSSDSDSMVENVDESYITNESHTRNVYVLLYDRIKCFNSSLTGLLQLLAHSSALSTYVDSVKVGDNISSVHRVQLAKLILSGDHGSDLVSLLSGILPDEMFGLSSYVSVLNSICNYLVVNTSLRINTFYFGSSIAYCNAHNAVIEIDHLCSCLTGHDVSKTLGKQLGGSGRFTSTPETLFIAVSGFDSISCNLDLCEILPNAVFREPTVYKLAGLALFNKGNKLHFENNFPPNDVNVANHAGIALYNIDKTDMWNIHCQIPTATDVYCPQDVDADVNLCLDTVKFSCSVDDKSDHTLVNNDHMKVVLSRNCWFTGDIVDRYMALLCNGQLHSRIKALACDWVGNSLFYNQDIRLPVRCFRNGGLDLFDTCGDSLNDYVIMPMSILNKHFVVSVIDFSCNVVFVCDPMCIRRPQIGQQIIRYINFKRAVETEHKRAVDSHQNVYCNTWNICHYGCDSYLFPKQSDNFNCGPYICMLVKCILQHKRLNFSDVFSLRQTIAYELMNNIIL